MRSEMRSVVDEMLGEMLAGEAQEDFFLAGLVDDDAPHHSLRGGRDGGDDDDDAHVRVDLAAMGGRELWDELLRQRTLRDKLSHVVSRRLDRCRDAAKQALAGANKAAELRAVVRGLATLLDSASDAQATLSAVDCDVDRALHALGRPDSITIHEDDSEGWVGSSQLGAACARARAEGRAEALGFLGERERLREKCALYGRRVVELEAEVQRKQRLSTVDLDDDAPQHTHADFQALQFRCDKAESKVAALVGTDRHRRLAHLETQLEERKHIVDALRAALEHVPNKVLDTAAAPPQPLRGFSDAGPPREARPPERAPLRIQLPVPGSLAPQTGDITPLHLMPSTSDVMECSAFDDDETDERGQASTDDGADARSAPAPPRSAAVPAPERPPAEAQLERPPADAPPPPPPRGAPSDAAAATHHRVIRLNSDTFVV
ncbi:hypothetical protein M885DRAFT_587806 [Pelagophyceae sp. CCMP2097]|nr:hypothetical protein M885DRAFT_587806 [Pelagophyceae sp. CCMP2097]